MRHRRKYRRSRRRNPAHHVVRDALVIAVAGVAGAWAGFAGGTLATGSKLTAYPYSFAGTIIGAGAAHFLLPA